MPGNTIDFELKLKTNLRGETDQAKLLNKELDKATTGRTTASAAAQSRDYGRASGVIGKTGAGARDFANEAQGLGGLVRVYATLAANTFAAVSAFNVLKQAADTTALREGLNQLGAASGIALGNLAKGFVAATDGAVSFREAASAAAKSTAAGLSSRQFLQIGEAAKTAAQALGIDMADATNRLVRGITKLEPELLDELGIYTKIGPAVEEYARKVGKASGSLSDFERRQAFAIAVLDEANKKFSEINIPTNPYQQLEASIRNVTQAILEVVNVALTPIVSIVANNTGILTVALAAIAVKLTKMAIPALTSWRTELKDAAEAAKARAQEIDGAFGKSSFEKIKESFKVPELQQNLQEVTSKYEASRQQLLNIDKDYADKRKSLIYKQARDPGGLESKTTQELKKMSASAQREITAQGKLGTDAAKLQVIALQEYKAAIREVILARRQLTAAESRAQEVGMKEKFTVGESVRRSISRQANARAQRLDILSQVGEDVQESGFGKAIEEMNKRISSSRDMNMWDRFRTRVAGTFSAITTSAGMFLSALAPMIQLLTLAGAGLAIFDGWASKNTKQMELFNKELEKNTETVDNAERVLKRYRDSFITTEQLQAVGTALGELTDGVTALSKSFQDTVANQGVWDGIKQGILSILGEGAQQDFAGAVASNWIKQIDMLPEGEVKSAVISKLQQVLNITDISVKGIKKAIADADVAKDVVARGEAALAPAVTRTRELGVQANSTRESITNLNKASLDLQNTFVDQSPIAKFAEALIKASLDIQKSFTTMEGSIAAFKEILSKPGAFSLIDINKLGQYQEAVKAQQEIIRLENERAAKQKSVEGLQGQLGEALRASGGRLTTPEQAATGLGTRSSRLAGRLQAQILSGQAEIEATTNKIDELTATGIKGLFNTVKETFGESVKKGFELLTTTANLALRQGELQISKAVIGGVSGPGVAQAQASLARQELAIQEQQVNIQGQLVDQLTLNTIAQQQANNLLQEAKIREKGGNLTQADEAILEQLSTSNQELAGLVQSIKTGAPISAGEIQKMGPQAGAIALQMALTRGGLEAQRAGFSSRRQIIAIDEEVNKLKEQQQIDLDIQNNLLKTLQYREKFVELSKSVLTNLSEQQIVESQILETNRVKKSQYIETLGLNSQIADLELRIKLEKDRGTAADAEILKGLATRLGYAKSILNITQNQQQKDLEILSIQQAQARIRAGLAKEAEDRQFNLFVQDKIQTVVEAELDAQSQLLEYQNSIGNLTADEYRLRKRNLDLRILEFDTVNKLRQIEGRRSEELAKIGGERTLAQAATGGVLSDADADRLYEREQRVNEQYNIEAQTLTRVNNLKKEGIYLTSSLNERQIAYGNMFKNTFDGLADALVKWAETGKWAGKDLFKSLTADLLRFELRAQTSQLYTSLIKPGLMTLLGRGPDLAMAGSYASAEGFAITNAKGGAYSFGIEKFAKGGMFTNSVINQPTLFKFARGTGLMGEAGPEAIMPLRRDGNGNLGVIGQQGKTQVVINNYSGERAETKETVDSRGNRKVEVVIGEAAALDLSTAGSSSQKSLRSTFGLAPQLIRR